MALRESSTYGEPSPEDMSAFVEELKRAAQSNAAEVLAAEEEVARSIEAPTSQIAHVIGLRGEHIALLNAQSGATIRVIHGVQRGRGRPAVSRLDAEGSKQNVAYALRLLEDRLAEVRTPRKISCDRTLIGKVIGRNGERVKEIQEVSGAHVQVDQRRDP